MSKIALVTDSTCDLNKDVIDLYDIKILPLRVLYKDKEYIDRVNITPQQVFDNLAAEVPTTSMPSIQDIEDLFTSLEYEGYTHVVSINISSGLSGTMNGIKLVSQNHQNLITYVFDSKSLSMALGALVIECGKLIKKGESFEKIVNILPSIRDRISVFFVVGTLEYLIKGGRIGKVSGTIGELLNIKPIISIDNEGKYYTYAKVRGRKQSINKLSEISSEYLKSNKSSVYIMQGAALDEGKKFYETVKNMPNIISLSLSELGPAMGVHSGPGLLGICFVRES